MMTPPLRYSGRHGRLFGGYRCRSVLPCLAAMGKAVAVAAVDTSEAALVNAREHLALPPERCYADFERALDENPAEFAIIAVPPAHHEAVAGCRAHPRSAHPSEKPLADSFPPAAVSTIR